MGTHLALLEHWSSDDNSFGGNEACVKQTQIIVKIEITATFCWVIFLIKSRLKSFATLVKIREMATLKTFSRIQILNYNFKTIKRPIFLCKSQANVYCVS